MREFEVAEINKDKEKKDLFAQVYIWGHHSTFLKFFAMKQAAAMDTPQGESQSDTARNSIYKALLM